jgi:hypothetical protein
MAGDEYRALVRYSFSAKGRGQRWPVKRGRTGIDLQHSHAAMHNDAQTIQKRQYVPDSLLCS